MMFPNPRFLALTAFTMLAMAASAQTINEDFKLLPDDGAAFDLFGGSIAISGTTVVVGAWQDDDNGNASGSAYLFDTTNGQQIAKLRPNDGAEGDNFGWSVAISGTTVVVGAWQDDDNGINSGSAYLFDRTTGQQIFKLLPNDGAAGNGFGKSVAISGTTVLVGARQDYDTGWDGAAYVFDTTTGQQIGKLQPTEVDEFGDFGWSVAISGTRVVVGAPRDSDNGIASGAIYVFETTSGLLLGKITPTDAATFDSFGNSVAISGTTAIVGADGDNPRGLNSGSAYLFNTNTGQQIAKLVPNDGREGDNFGYAVAISGSTAVVGAYLDVDDGTSSGSAYLFDTNTGEQIAKLLTDDRAATDQAGKSVAISGETAGVGAPQNDDNGSNSGSAYVFPTSPTPCPADLTGDGELNFFDVSVFLTYFQLNDPIADFTGDGQFNFFDVSAFLNEYIAGCP